MNKICTTIEQSKKLTELGIDVNTADMYYSFDYNIEEYEEDAQIIPQSEFDQHFSLFPEDVPAWSFPALLIVYGNINFDVDDQYSFKDMVNTDQKEDPIDATFQMVVWLLENKKI